MSVIFDHPPATQRIPTPPSRPIRTDWSVIAANARHLVETAPGPPPVAGSLPSTSMRFVIRAIDLVIGTVALVAALPLMIVLGLLVSSTSWGLPVTWTWRVGRNGEMFACLRLRTTVPDPDDDRGVPRPTRVGRALRSTHLDVLPQLVNVVAGRMSLVGPYAMVPSEVTDYGTAVSSVLGVKPGIIGPRRSGTRADRIAADVAYSRALLPQR